MKDKDSIILENIYSNNPSTDKEVYVSVDGLKIDIETWHHWFDRGRNHEEPPQSPTMKREWAAYDAGEQFSEDWEPHQGDANDPRDPNLPY